MTDERIGDRLWQAIDRLTPDASGIVFRHYATGPDARVALGRRIADICRARGFALAVARDQDLAHALDADLIHNPPAPATALPFSMAVHSIEEAQAARRAGADLVFVSPVHATRSHPDAEPLGERLALTIAREAAVPAIALGGMNSRKFARLQRDGFYGWAGIDAWLP